MGIETYLLIAVCYGLGCYLSWKIGVNQGVGFALRQTAIEISEISDKTAEEILVMIRNHRRDKAEKALKS